MNYSQMTDEMLCRMASEGQLTAEEELVLRYGWLVRVCARPLFLMGGDSEDLTQEGMVGLVMAVRRYQPERGGEFRTFAETCIRNRLYSAIRFASGKHHTPLNESVPIETTLSEESYQQAAQLPENDPETILISRETAQEILNAVFRSVLSSFEASVLRHYLDGLSYAAIAEQMNCTVKAVDNAVQRIRRKLGKSDLFPEKDNDGSKDHNGDDNSDPSHS